MDFVKWIYPSSVYSKLWRHNMAIVNNHTYKTDEPSVLFNNKDDIEVK